MTPSFVQYKVNGFINDIGKKRQDYMSILALIKSILTYGASLDLKKDNLIE